MTKKQLKQENKELRETIDKLIDGTWMEKVMIVFSHKLKYDRERLLWYGKRDTDGKIVNERL